MSNQSKLFTEELARRNPDWEKIVAVHNAALATERKAAEVKANEDVAVRDINHLKRIDELEQQLAAEREKVTILANAIGKSADILDGALKQCA